MKRKVITIEIEELLNIIANRAVDKVMELKDYEDFIDIDFSFEVDEDTLDIQRVEVILNWEKDQKQ